MPDLVRYQTDETIMHLTLLEDHFKAYHTDPALCKACVYGKHSYALEGLARENMEIIPEHRELWQELAAWAKSLRSMELNENTANEAAGKAREFRHRILEAMNIVENPRGLKEEDYESCRKEVESIDDPVERSRLYFACTSRRASK
jgi:hypothetical protein